MMQEGKREKLKKGVVAHGLGRRRVVELRIPLEPKHGEVAN